MKLMTFNCRGLVGPLKRPSLKRVVNLEHPDVILLQETLGKGEEVKSRLEGMFSGWSLRLWM
jgi:exonuclease III